ncbi:uncharacterized protein SAPINGB_P003804 [Magnusiomyces paraingens]|uniref:Uncharacterized protein n=1 Tax=Magnusiomyces paraingens TaxID=2606893 RepID=A0A5E8BYN7_9ASCO|nr:uncharacterized protein SAPINGB_P003804 [Saprochaete ingens]VVT53895.1 unnamed protein product [Saprochaete ingens]
MSLINSTSALRQKLLPGIQKSISTIRAQRLHSARRLCKPSPTPQQQQPRIPYEPVAPGEKPISPHIAIYVSFGRPFLKIVAVALTTFFTLKYTRIALVAEHESSEQKTGTETEVN